MKQLAQQHKQLSPYTKSEKMWLMKIQKFRIILKQWY